MANYTKEQLELIKEFVAEQERLRQVTKDNLSILQKGTPEYAAQSQQLQDINEELTKGRDKLTEIQRQRRLNNAELKEEIALLQQTADRYRQLNTNGRYKQEIT